MNRAHRFSRVWPAAPGALPFSTGIALIAASLCFLMTLSRAHAQPDPDHGVAVSTVAGTDSVTAAFLDRIRRSTDRYRDHSTAVAAGYRWMGPDMPNMGEHWINPQIVMRRPFDPMRPSCLSYIRVGNRRVLTGVAYIVPVRAGEAPPSLPVSAGTWHYHTSTLDQEAFTAAEAHHHGSDPSPGSSHPLPAEAHAHPTGDASHAGNEMRLAMMHVWAWTPNPDGPLAADNWGLSYARLDLPLPDTVAVDASKALFLLAEDGIEYYQTVLRVNASPRPAERAALRSILRDGRRRVRGIVDRQTPGQVPPTALLAAEWRRIWSEIRVQIRPETWEAVKAVVAPSGQ